MTPGLPPLNGIGKPSASNPTGGPPRPWGGWPVVRPVPSWRIWAWGVAYWLALVPLTWTPRLNGNVASRLMTIEAIVERGTLALERSPLLRSSGSPDIVHFGPHAYSDKPPVLPLIASPIYAALFFIGGIRLAGPPLDFLISNFALAWGVAGLASALTLVAFRAILQTVAIPRWSADLATLAFGAASPLLTYAVTFNNHSVAAGCITGAWAITLLEGSKPRRSRFVAGTLAGLAATIDLPIGCLTAAGLAIFPLVRSRGGDWTYFAGVLGPVLLHSWSQSLVTGTPLPAEMYPAAFEYPGSYWLTPEGIWKEIGPRWLFGLDFMVGRQGAFTVFPALWFGLFGLAGAAVGQRSDRSDRPAARIIVGSLLVLGWYYIWGVRRTDFAGTSFGVRHLLAITPMVYLFAVVGLSRIGRWRGVALGLFIAGMGIGGVYAVKGMINPWTRVEMRAETDGLLRTLQRGALFQGGTFRGDTRQPRPQPGAGR